MEIYYSFEAELFVYITCRCVNNPPPYSLCIQTNISHIYGYFNCSSDCNLGTYWKNCEHDCGHCKDNEQCDIENGRCSRGCETWYMSDTCKTYISKYNSYDGVVFYCVCLILWGHCFSKSPIVSSFFALNI